MVRWAVITFANTQRVYHTETDGRISPSLFVRRGVGHLSSLTLDRPYYARVCENDSAVPACRAVAHRKRRRFQIPPMT